jgi:hypothetical protein
MPTCAIGLADQVMLADVAEPVGCFGDVLVGVEPLLHAARVTAAAAATAATRTPLRPERLGLRCFWSEVFLIRFPSDRWMSGWLG